MNHHKMDRRIRIERYTETRDSMNQPVKTWAELATVWAEKSEVSDAERVRSQEVGAEITTRFRIRWSDDVADVNPKDRVVFNDLNYDIVGAKEIGRQDGLEISAVARAD